MSKLSITNELANLQSNHTDDYIQSVKAKSESLGKNENFIDATNDVYFD